MRLIFEQSDRVKLVNVSEYDHTDWGMSIEEHQELIDRSENGDVFEIVREVTDDYYDIVHIESGTHYAAVSDYHIIPTADDLRVLMHRFS